MTTSLSSAPSAAPSRQLFGQQTPRVSWVPDYSSGTGDEAVELCHLAGLELDPWQEFTLRHSLGERADGKWAAYEVGIVVPRQNGKNEIAIARELTGLFLLGERLLIHSAHQFDTSLEAFDRLLDYIDGTPEFVKRVRKVSRSHGTEGITLKNGQRIRFRTRTKGGGRGFSCDWLLSDEAMELAQSFHGALMPTLSARPNPQLWYMGSPVDQEVHDNGLVLSKIRERGIEGGDPSLMYVEWSVDADGPDSNEAAAAAEDVEAWATANPGFGIRIDAEHIAAEQRSMDSRTFAVERLGIGDWPLTDEAEDQVLDLDAWQECADEDSRAQDPVVLAFDVAPDRGWASIGSAGIRPDGNPHIEVVDRKRGTGWVVDRLYDLAKKWKPAKIMADERGPAAALIEKANKRLKPLGMEIETINGREYADACGAFYDEVAQRTLRHLDTPELNSAVKGASTRPLSDAWAWSRKASSVDITPLVSCTIALRGVGAPKSPAPFIEVF